MGEWYSWLSEFEQTDVFKLVSICGFLLSLPVIDHFSADQAEGDLEV